MIFRAKGHSLPNQHIQNSMFEWKTGSMIKALTIFYVFHNHPGPCFLIICVRSIKEYYLNLKLALK